MPNVNVKVSDELLKRIRIACANEDASQQDWVVAAIQRSIDDPPGMAGVAARPGRRPPQVPQKDSRPKMMFGRGIHPKTAKGARNGVPLSGEPTGTADRDGFPVPTIAKSVETAGRSEHDPKTCRLRGCLMCEAVKVGG